MLLEQTKKNTVYMENLNLFSCREITINFSLSVSLSPVLSLNSLYKVTSWVPHVDLPQLSLSTALTTYLWEVAGAYAFSRDFPPPFTEKL